MSEGKVRSQVLESSDDESLQENYEEISFVSEFKNCTPVVTYENEDKFFDRFQRFVSELTIMFIMH